AEFEIFVGEHIGPAVLMHADSFHGSGPLVELAGPGSLQAAADADLPDAASPSSLITSDR
ncbi:MAG: hypothetical protein AAAB14_24535, partial [Ensifer adhaerens]